MRTKGLLLLVVVILSGIFWSCNDTTTPYPTASKLEKESLVSTLLIRSAKNCSNSFAHHLWLANLPKLPQQEYFFIDMVVDASWKACEKTRKRLFGAVLSQIPTTLDAQAKVTYLDFSNQNIRYLPNELEKLPNLRHLVLRNNNLRDINPSLSKCINLKTLDLSTNGWTSIPSDLIYLKQLRDLKLMDNELSTLPSFLQNLKGLRTLDISNVHPAMAQGNNTFQEVPHVVGRMPWLEKLLMEYLPIRRLPGDMLRMVDLKVLSLKGCRGLDWQQTFEILARMPNLKVLDISFIGLRSLPYNISKLKHLKVLVWSAENNRNAHNIEQLKKALPNTKIYHNPSKEAIPFIRGNSIKTLVGAGK